jgi:hypothetical protein
MRRSTHIKVPLSALEEARANPAAFRARLDTSGGDKRPFTFGRPQLIECAILRYHKRQMGVAAARQHLIEWYQEKFGDDARLDEAVRAFEDYIADLDRIGHAGRLTITRFKTDVALPPDLSDRFAVTGLVSRVDTTADGGYAAWLFSKRRADWGAELRLPLIQSVVAARLGADLEEVSVGAYCFENGRHYSFSFSQDDCEAAANALHQILRQFA